MSGRFPGTVYGDEQEVSMESGSRQPVLMSTGWPLMEVSQDVWVAREALQEEVV